MKIYYTDSNGIRQLQECNLSETEVLGKIATNGVIDHPVYQIINVPFVEDVMIVTFGGEKHIGKNLRDSFWKCIANTFKHNIPIFDVDEWYDNIQFVTPEEKALLKQKKKRR